jgi:hypothetical protein
MSQGFARGAYPVGTWSMSLLQSAVDTSERSHTTNNTWEDISGASITFAPAFAGKYLVMFHINWRTTNTDWVHHQVRCLLDGATTNVSPTSLYLAQEDAAGASDRFSSTATFEVDFPSTSSQTVKIQTHDSNSSLNRLIMVTYLQIWGPGG